MERIRTEFENSPVQVTAAAIALVVGPITIALNYALGTSVAGATGINSSSVAAADAPVRLLLVALFAILISFGLSRVLALAKNFAGGILLAAVLMFVAQLATATFARQVLVDQFEFVTRTATAAQPTKSSLFVAGIGIDAFVFGACLLIGVVFMAVALGAVDSTDSDKTQRPEQHGTEGDDANLEAIPFVFALFVLPLVLIGGLVFEAFLRAGLTSLGG